MNVPHSEHRRGLTDTRMINKLKAVSACAAWRSIRVSLYCLLHKSMRNLFNSFFVFSLPLPLSLSLCIVSFGSSFQYLWMDFHEIAFYEFNNFSCLAPAPNRICIRPSWRLRKRRVWCRALSIFRSEGPSLWTESGVACMLVSQSISKSMDWCHSTENECRNLSNYSVQFELMVLGDFFIWLARWWTTRATSKFTTMSMCF